VQCKPQRPELLFALDGPYRRPRRYCVLVTIFVLPLQKPLDLAAITAGGMTGGAKDMLLQHEAGSGNMQMAFATLRKGVAKNDKEINELAGKWQALLQTNGVKISFHPIGGDDLLLTEDGGRIIEARDFILNQPEVEKFRWKDTDFTPTPTPQPAEQAASPKSSGKGRTGKDKKGGKKAAATPSAKPKKGKKAAKQQKTAGKGGDARDEL